MTPRCARTRRALCLGGGLLIAGCPAHALDVAMALPFEARITSVIEAGSIDGRPVRVHRFSADVELRVAVEAIVRAWSDLGRVPVVETRSGTWHVVSARDAAGYRTVQLRGSGPRTLEGLISTWSDAAPGERARFDPARVLPPEGRVLRRLAAVDAGRRSETVVAVAPGSAAWHAAGLDARLRALGLRADPLVRASPAGHARIARGASVELAITLTSQPGRTGFVIHLTEEQK